MRDCFEKRAHGHCPPEPRHVGAQAEVGAGPETQMPARIALDVIRVGACKLALVSIRRSIGERHLVALAHMLAMKFDVPGKNTLETLRRGIEAQRFLDRRTHERGILEQLETLPIVLA